jgi:serine/threonine protein kinase/beta-lactam-binding protein with PASTA domain
VDRTAADPLIGRVLDGRYRVGARVARGGMATVYEAVDLRLDRVCALKVMHSGLGDDDDFAGRFVREARAAARLSHPNVVAVYDQGDDSGTVFLAMEYVPGHTLRDMIRKEAPMPAAKALALIDPVLSALAAAHHAGMIHRDVKPENVLLADDGGVKVADFGLARAVTAETQHTATGGVLIGTVSYLSPELVADGRADARSDVYAAGVVLYEMLTGRKPHEGESPIQVAYKHVHEDVPPPSREIPGIPAYVDALVARATARDRDLRPADARVMLHQVRRVRAALDHGIVDDPELTDDLTPTVPVQRLSRDADDIDYHDEPLRPVLSTSQVATAGRTDVDAPALVDDATDDTDVIGPRPTTKRPGRPPTRPAPPPKRSAPPPAARRRSRRGWVLLLVVLLLAVAAGVGGWWFGAGRYVSTPGVVNLTPRAAETKVEAAGLSFAIGGRDYSETVPAGRIMRTDPEGGDHITRDGTVTATLSRGPERHKVPTLRGLSLDDAQAAIQGAHLAYGQATYAYDDKVAKGVVLRSDPADGTSLHRNAAVDVVVSKGPHPVKVPDVTDKRAHDAVTTLKQLHLKADISRENSDTVDRGDVISQSPDSGKLHRGDTVDLVVSKGPVLVEVPEVQRMSASSATAKLEAAGFSVSVVKTQYYIGLGLVVRQSPGAGSKAPKGSTITIAVV